MTTKTPLARKNLLHQPRRLAVALGGISFAVILMFMQTGFENALFDSTVEIVRQLNADLLIFNKAQFSLIGRESFSRQRIYQARGCEGVKTVYPLYVEAYAGIWQRTRSKGQPPPAKAHPIRVIGCDPRLGLFLDPGIRENSAELQQPGTALIDVNSDLKTYGLPRSKKELLQIRDAELSGQAIRLVGTFKLAADFANRGNLLMSDSNFADYFPFRAPPGGDPLDTVDIGVVRIEPGADAEAVKRRLNEHLAEQPPDSSPDAPRNPMQVYTKQEFIDREIDFWSETTPVGFVFLLGTMLGWVVGVIICYQIIHSDISDHMPEFATLKAMGYPNRYFIGVVLTESVYLSVLGFIPGLLVSLVLYRILALQTGLLMMLNFERGAGVFLMTLAMCVISGCLAMRKVLAADPADLF